MTDHTFHIKQGDLLPIITETLEGQDATTGAWGPIDLTNCAVEFHLKRRTGEPVVSGPAGVSGDPVDGVVQYAWAAGDTDDSGVHIREWEITYANTKTLTVPNRGRYPVNIVPQIA